jgi:hypothetical protein
VKTEDVRQALRCVEEEARPAPAQKLEKNG